VTGSMHTPVATERASASVHRLTTDEVPGAVDVLCRAFDEDPFVDWTVRSDARRADGYRRFFTVCLRQLTMPFGEVWATDDLAGVAMWTPPDEFDVGLAAQLRFLWQAARAFKLANVASRISAFNEVERHHPAAPHYYLFIMGVDPDCQGRGIGLALMKTVLGGCDAEGTPAYLEATHEGLVPFYSRLGYRAREPFRLPHGGPMMYPMWRDPSGMPDLSGEGSAGGRRRSHSSVRDIGGRPCPTRRPGS